MDSLQEHDVPYGNDWESAAEVTAWADAADRIRPWRLRIRDAIADRIAALPAGARVLELGSGPGFLAQRILERCPGIAGYTLLDFSEQMLALSRERLAGMAAARFVHGSFKSGDWLTRVGQPFDCVVSMQAIHELRNKRHALPLYRQVHEALALPGLLIICDHTPLDDTARSAALYMTEQEQLQTLTAAGFVNAHIALSIDSLVVYVGERAG